MSMHHRETGELARDTGGQPPDKRDRRRWPPSPVWMNWVLAVLTVPVAAGAMIFAVDEAVSMAVCSTAPCPDLGPNGLIYSVLLYAAPLAAAATITVSIFTATRRRGVVVPLCGLALLLADIVATAILFRS
jgi:hypothetical protein